MPLNLGPYLAQMITHGSKIEKKYRSQTLIDKGISKKDEKKWELFLTIC
tara:strand:- start:884 stop:1030 length:147 start_codon:yes stop_codon:yes gene_type:complete